MKCRWVLLSVAVIISLFRRIVPRDARQELQASFSHLGWGEREREIGIRRLVIKCLRCGDATGRTSASVLLFIVPASVVN